MRPTHIALSKLLTKIKGTSEDQAALVREVDPVPVHRAMAAAVMQVLTVAALLLAP